MPTIHDVLGRASALGSGDLEWLHLLVGDWQVLADLSFADLVLWVRLDGEPGQPLDTTDVHTDDPATWMVAAHVRPNTGPLVFVDDLVGCEADAGRRVLLEQSARGERIIRDRGQEWRGDAAVREEAMPVVREGRVIAVVTRHSNLASTRSTGRLELVYRDAADRLAAMVTRGEFPTMGAATGQRRGAPRVGDGVIVLDVEGVIEYASPNAVSALHRIGHVGEVVGRYLSEITTDVLEDHTTVDESLALVALGRAPWRSDVEAHGGSLSMRAVPLTVRGERDGAVVLVRDVSELRRRERELLTKDATIREIHHRVKNNLQTVAALLRLQARRVPDTDSQAALQEAGRRVATIALVHDTLSQTLDEVVDFDTVLQRCLKGVVEVANGDLVTWRIEGSFGPLAAEDATALAMIVTELVQNAIEHGLGDQPGTVTIRASRTDRSTGADDLLEVEVADDGVGLPEDFRPGRSSLGTRITAAFVQDLRGTISWNRAEPRGTSVRFVARPRPVRRSSTGRAG